MIYGIENFVKLFDIFHDGRIAHAELVGDKLQFQVEIGYLAKRVNSEYSEFSIELHKMNYFKFEGWLNGDNNPNVIVTDVRNTFDLLLEIYSASSDGDTLKIDCGVRSDSCDIIGGSLYLIFDSAVVYDEGGSQASVEGLARIRDEYWQELEKFWQERRKGK